MAIDKKKKPHYVNNKEFLQAMIDWKATVVEAEANDESRPQVTNYIGECFLKIANHLSYRPNFINYTYRENCLQYIDNFDPEKSKNPFAYFTQIIYFAFVRRITREKKQSKIKDKLLKASNLEDMIMVQEHDDAGAYQKQFMEFLQQYNFSDPDDK